MFMKKIKKILILGGIVFFFSSCAIVKSPLGAVLYTDVGCKCKKTTTHA